ncbi:MAG: DHHW family protein [Christensenella sp.]|nr:DHHW family protein [Christensenella sp.]
MDHGKHGVSFKSMILIVVFCAFIGGMFVLFLALPKVQTSQEERRVLEKAPELSFQSVTDGSFEDSAERYISDHFPGRKVWLGINAYYNLLTGRNGESGMYAGKDNYLIATPINFDQSKLDANIGAINAFAENTDVPVSVMIVPSTGYVMEELLPENHKVYPDAEILDQAQSAFAGKTGWIDLRETFLAQSTKQQLYYKTDHHWTSEGAYLAYTEYADSMGFTPLARDIFTVETTDGFYGTSYAKSCLWLTPPDTLEIWRYPIRVTVEIKDDNKPEPVFSDTMFFEDRLSETDKYSVFLDGNHSMARIMNPDAKGGKLLIIKDSFAHCMAPFLAKEYSEIDMVDLRYFKRQSVSELMKERGITQVLVLYGVDDFVNDNNISFLQ